MKIRLLICFLFLYFTSLIHSATYIVDNNGDADDGLGYTAADGTNTLRKCIRLANANAGADNITFNLGTTGGPFAINLTSDLPAITDASGGLTIDGWTNTSNNGTPNSVLVKSTSSASPMNPVYKIIINNSSGTVSNGLTLQSNSNIIQGLAFYNIGVTTLSTKDTCIAIRGNSNQVLGCFIGISTDGTTGLRRTEFGVCIRGANNSIGNATAAGANLISGTNDSLNFYAGIIIAGAAASGNSVKGNMIGLQKDGETTTTSEQQQNGIYIYSSGSGNTIGGTNANDGNVISGNKASGIYLISSSNGNTIKGNFIGPRASGNALVSGTSQFNGLIVNSSANNIIGGTGANEKNVVSGNVTTGVQFVQSSSTGNIVKGNYIGIGADGTTDITAQDYGIYFQTAANANTIGGTASNEGNVISGNGNGAGTGYGIYFLAGGPPAAYNNSIIGNIIGLKADGITFHTSDQSHGIYLQGYSNTIGGSSTSHKNVISGNGTYGIYITSSNGYNNAIQGNYIGMRSTGTAIVTSGDQDYGIYITSSAYNNTIGGTNSGEGNLISGNITAGIYSNSSNTNGNKIYGNIIGLQSDGITYLASNSQDYGIQLFTSHNNVIGGSTSNHRNVISGNLNTGIHIDLTTTGASTGNVIKGNYIGLAGNGTAHVANSAQFGGIQLGGTCHSNIIGGTATGEKNVISGQRRTGGVNECYGIWIFSSSTTGNTITGNFVGCAADGVSALTGKAAIMQDIGIAAYGAINTTIERNVLLDNSLSGIQIYYNIYAPTQVTRDITIKGNYIGVGSDGITTIAGNSQNIGIEAYGTSAKRSYNITIGGTTAGDGNIISGNNDGAGGGKGIHLDQYNYGHNIFGNIIGPQNDGSTFLALEQQYGIYIDGSYNNTIGGSSSAYRNIISGNGEFGIYITAATATGNIIKGNYIGPASNGTSYISGSAQSFGIHLNTSANSNTIGGSNPGEGNLISAHGSEDVGTTGEGIHIETNANNNTIIGNIIGPDKTGSSIISSGSNHDQIYGIYLDNAYSNTIGGSSSAHRNIISANNNYGIYLTGASSTANLIKGNYIGLASNGTSYVTSNSQNYGIYLTSSANSNIIGGSVAGEGNVISGNSIGGTSASGVGVFTNSTHTSGNTFIGNVIGPQFNGNSWITNEQVTGIQISGSPNNIIGGSSSLFRNIIAANGNQGMYISGAGSTGNVIKGNYIGLQSAGTNYITSSSQDWGIRIVSGNANIIGGSNPGEGNIISGQGTVNGPGINLGSNSNIVYGNFIGPRPDGSTVVTSNVQEYGFWITGQNNIIGGTASGMRNIISGNRTCGMVFDGAGCTGNTVRGNYIGLASNGTAFIASSTQDYGVYLQTSVRNNIIGGTNTNEGNVISGQSGASTSYGIYCDAVSLTNQVYGNIIGPQKDGSTYLASNDQDCGVYIASAGNTIGGSSSAYRNIISANNLYGIYIEGAASSSNAIKGNYIGIASNGTSLIGSSSQDYGVYTHTNCPSITIGGTNAGEGNVISGNTNSGIYFTVAGSHNVYQNIIGAPASGTTSLGASNQNYGVYIDNCANNVIGGSSSSFRNIISDNNVAGVYVTSSLATSNIIKGNYIGPNASLAQITGSSQDNGIVINGANSNTIGGSAGGASNPEGNTVAYNTTNGISVTNGGTGFGRYNSIMRNLIYSNTSKAIVLNAGPNQGNEAYAVPVVYSNFTANSVSGTAAANDIIDVFEAVISSSVTTTAVCQSAQVYLGTTTADGSGNWTLSGFTLSGNGTPIATARSATNNNTSECGCPPSISLPIELISFDAKKINETTVKTCWQTASEINNDYFTVETTPDPSKGGESWSVVGTIPGAGNSSTVKNYSLMDYSPLFGRGQGWAYYRLKQTDFDGSYSYSDIVAVDFGNANSSISNFNIFPNPTTGENININLTTDINSEVLIIVRDILGKELYAKAFVTDKEYMIIRFSDGFFLPAGIYTVIASNNDKLVSKKLIIK